MDIDFDVNRQLRHLHTLTLGRRTPPGDYAADLIRVHAETLAELDAAHRTINLLRGPKAGEALAAIATADPDGTLADAYEALEAAYIQTVRAVDQYHAWLPGTLPADRCCEGNCGACQILCAVPESILTDAVECVATETGATQS